MTMLIPEIQRALQNQSLDVEIMRCIARTRSPYVSSLADALGKQRHIIKEHLWKLKAYGCVKDRWIRMTPSVEPGILCHEWPLTRKGKRLLREGGLIYLPAPT